MSPISITAGSPLIRTSETASSRNNKVLLLEDDPTLREAIEDFLTKNGFEVIAVRNGLEGVHQVREGDFEVILSDLMMPALPGDVFYRAISRMRPDLRDRFIFMTGHTHNQAVMKMVSSLRGPVLYKPFRLDDLLENIAFIRVRMIHLAA